MEQFREYLGQFMGLAAQPWTRDVGLLLGVSLVAYLPARLLRRWMRPRFKRREAASPLLVRNLRIISEATAWPLIALVLLSVGFSIWTKTADEVIGNPFAVIPVLGFFLLYRLLSGLTKEFIPRGPKRRQMRRVVLPLVFILATLQQLDVLGPFLVWLDRPFFNLGGNEISALSVLLAVILIIVFVAVARLVEALMSGRILPNFGLDPPLSEALATVIRYVVAVWGVLIALETIGFDLSSLKIAFGALSVGIGFGLQNIVNNFVSGLILLFERTVKKGDVVEVGGVDARVLRIGLRSSVVRTRRGHEIIVPNSDLVTSQVTNFSFSDPVVRLDISVGVSYNADPNELRELLRTAAAEEKRVLEKPRPEVVFLQYGESSIDFELRVWVSTEWIAPQIRSDLLFSIWYKLKTAGIEIPFPQRDLHFRSGEINLAAGPPHPGAHEPVVDEG